MCWSCAQRTLRQRSDFAFVYPASRGDVAKRQRGAVVSVANAVDVRPSQPLRSGAEKGSFERGLFEALFLYAEFRSALFCEHRKEPPQAAVAQGVLSFAYFSLHKQRKVRRRQAKPRTYNLPPSQPSALARCAYPTARQSPLTQPSPSWGEGLKSTAEREPLAIQQPPAQQAAPWDWHCQRTKLQSPATGRWPPTCSPQT